MNRRLSRRSLRVDPSVLEMPCIAWPTVLVAVVAAMLWSLSLWCLCHQELLSEVVCVAMSSVAAFLAFTPAHDASHWAIGRSSRMGRIVNESVGRLCATVLLAPFPAFRYCHLLHHKHTNVPGLDPDYYSKGGPLCWLTQELYYYYYVWKDLDRVPRQVLAETVVTALFLVTSLVTVTHSVGLRVVVLGMLLPQRLAATFLAYSFDFVPHHGAVDRPTDEYRTTRFVASYFPSSYADVFPELPAWTLRLILMGQDAHVIHHLYPSLPFYKYHGVWNRYAMDLRARGVKDTSLFLPSKH